MLYRVAGENGVFGAYVDSEGSDQTAHWRSLIRAAAVRLQNYWVTIAYHDV